MIGQNITFLKVDYTILGNQDVKPATVIRLNYEIF